MNKISVLMAGMFFSATVAAADLSLEPCINGDVSKSGTSINQYAEDNMMRTYRPEQEDNLQM